MTPGDAADDGLLPPGYDELVDASSDIDRFCSSSDWVVPTQLTWGGRRTWRATAPGAALVLTHLPVAGRHVVWCGLDPMWGFACPALGPDPAAVAGLVAAALAGELGRWDAVLLTGLVPGSARESALRRSLGVRHRLRPGPAMTRQQARLEDGMAAYLARRSARFRRNLVRAERARRAEGLGIDLVRGGGADVVRRCVAVEHRSWKGRQGGGLAEPSMARFYGMLAAGLAPSGRLRAGFARWQGRDVGYILGVVRGPIYRGLQLSFAEDQAERSLGNLLQLHQMEALVDEGVSLYDLGMDMAYKRRWADEALTTETLAVLAG